MPLLAPLPREALLALQHPLAGPPRAPRASPPPARPRDPQPSSRARAARPRRALRAPARGRSGPPSSSAYSSPCPPSWPLSFPLPLLAVSPRLLPPSKPTTPPRIAHINLITLHFLFASPGSAFEICTLYLPRTQQPAQACLCVCAGVHRPTIACLRVWHRACAGRCRLVQACAGLRRCACAPHA